MTDLPAMGLIQYGKFIFADAVTETTNCSIKPQYDAGRRTVTHSVWDLTLRSYIDGNPSDENVQAAIAELTKAGQPFRYTGHGCGNLRVNIGGPIDVAWGPLPQVVSLKPIGGKRVCEITWNVQVAVPTCADGVTRFTPLEFSFTLGFDIAQNGFTTRRYTGTLRIPNNRLFPGGRLMLDTPDSYREDLTPPLQEGFRRTQQSFEIDESKTKLTVSITDQEFGPNNLPIYIIDGTASHSYNSVPGKMGKVWHGTLEAEFEVPRHRSGTYAAEQFLNLLKDRLDSAGKMKALGRGGAELAKPIPVSFSVSEPRIFGPGGMRGKFSCTYLVAAVELPEILRSGGLWQSTVGKPGTGLGNWKEWYSTVTSVTGPRGVAGIRFNHNEDSLVDLCGVSKATYPNIAPPPRSVENIAPPPRPVPGGFNFAINAGLNAAIQLATSSGLFGPQSPFQVPGEEGGWLEVQSSTYIEEDHGTVVANTLPSAAISRSTPRVVWDVLKFAIPGAEALGGSTIFPPGAIGNSPSSSSSSSSSSTQGDVRTQQRASPVSYLHLRGTALRWGRPIPCPTVVDVNGKTVTNCNRLDCGEGFVSGVAGYAVLPVYWASWNLRYEASEAVRSVGNFPIPQAAL